MKKLKEVITWILLTIIFVFTVINGVLLIKNRVYKIETPDFAGYIPFIMETDSMNPELKLNDFIIDKKINSESELKVGQNISYKYEDKVITHKIDKIIVQDGQKKYAMKNTKSDGYTAIITYSDMRGIVLFKIPLLGQIIKYSRTTIGIISIITIIVISFVLLDIIARRIKIKKINQLKYELEEIIAEKEKIENDRKRRNNK